jgi:PAS domain S-box-containing protein
LDFRDFIHPDDAETAFAEATASIEARQRHWQQSYRVLDALGEERVVEDYSMLVLDDEGEALEVIGYLQDQSERHALESELLDSSQSFEMVIRGTGIGTWDWRVQEGEVAFNERWADIIGYSLEELEPMSIETWLSFAHPEDLEVSKLKLERHFAGETSLYECECRMRHRDGHWIWVLDRGKVVQWDAEGKPVRMLGTHGEITERKEMEQRLAEALEAQETINLELEEQIARASALASEAEFANQAKSDFLANMSHEIRTPMTAILGFTELLEERMAEGQLDFDEARESIGVVQRNGEYLLTLINDILDLSKIDAGKVELDREAFDLQELVDGLVELMTARVREKGLELEVDMSAADTRVLVGDSTRVRQVLVNLIGNSIKFTSKGLVCLRCRTESAGDEVLLVCEVEDQGIGMTPEQVEHVFRPFEQADSSTTRESGGTGLGLAISRKLAELHGGSLAITRSAPGEGSVFELRVRCEVATESFSRKAEHRAGSKRSGMKLGARILLAEDGVDNVRLFKRVLEKAGADVDVAENGRIAVEMVMAADEVGVAYDLVLMDMQMPELDGYGATRRLRRKGFELPIIALTAHAMAGDRETCLEAGCSGYATKPLDKAALFAEIATALEGSQ